MSEILDNIYIWVFSINTESVLLLALVKYMLCGHFTQNCIFCTFWMLKTLVLWRKIVENLLILVYLFCPKNGAIDFTKTSITQKWLVVESCPIPRWIAFLMFQYTLSFQWIKFGLKWLFLRKTEVAVHRCSIKNCSEEIWKIHRKTHMQESLFK